MVSIELLKHLDMINKKLLKKKILKYRSSKLGGLSREQLSEKIMEVLCTEPPDGQSSFMMQANRLNYPTGTILYRVRWIDPTEDPLNPNSMTALDSAWMPPAGKVQPGRVNRKGEALLYTAADPATALAEARIKDGDMFALISYESKSNCNLNSIGMTDAQKNYLDASRRAKAETLEEFLISEFSRNSRDGKEHIYLASDIITKDYYDYPETIGWAYKSVATSDGVNICFKGETAKQYLEAKTIVIGKLHNDKKDQKIEVMSFCFIDKESPEYSYVTEHKGGTLPGPQRLI